MEKDIQAKLAEATKELARLKEELRVEQEKVKNYNVGLECGTQISAMLKGLIDGGLTEKQAWEFIMFQIKSSLGGFR